MSNRNQLIRSDSAPRPSTDEEHSDISDEADPTTDTPFTDSAAGVAKVKALQTVWGKKGKRILWFGLALMLSVTLVILSWSILIMTSKAPTY